MGVGRRHRGAALEPIGRVFRTGTAAGLSDGQLLERFATRHDEAAEAAFAALVDRHGPMVLGVCRRVLNDPNDAHDAFQATFLVLVRKAGEVRRGESLAGWLYGVARRVSAHSRASSRRRRAVEQAAASARPPSWEPGQPVREVWDEVDRLPAPLRTAVVLCYLEGLTHEQASARLGWPVGTVRSRLARARDILRSRLTRRGLAPGTALVPMLTSPTSAPSSLLAEPTVKAAMLVAAWDAVEAGLVSAQAASLTQGVLRIMLVTKLKAPAIALLAAGAVATGTWALAFQDGPAGSALPDHPGLTSSRRMTDQEYGLWSKRINRTYKDRLLKLVEAAALATNQGDLDAAAEQTVKIEETTLAWRKALKPSTEETTRAETTSADAAPGSRNFVYYGNRRHPDGEAARSDVPSPEGLPTERTIDLAAPSPDLKPPSRMPDRREQLTSVGYLPRSASNQPLPPVPPAPAALAAPSAEPVPTPGSVEPPAPAAAPAPPAVPAPGSVEPPALLAAHAPEAFSVPPQPPAAPGAPASPAAPEAEPAPVPPTPPTAPSEPAQTFPWKGTQRSKAGQPQATSPRGSKKGQSAKGQSADTVTRPPASPAERLDQLEEKVDRILKALEKDRDGRTDRQDKSGAAMPVSKPYQTRGGEAVGEKPPTPLGR